MMLCFIFTMTFCNTYMKPAYIFIIVVACYFLGMTLKQDTIQFIFKPLLISSLLFYFVVNTKQVRSILKKWITGALIFSIAGDTLLMFANANELFFILGLCAFLVAHLFYIYTFHQIRARHDIAGKWYAAIIVVIYYHHAHVCFGTMAIGKRPIQVY